MLAAALALLLLPGTPPLPDDASFGAKQGSKFSMVDADSKVRRAQEQTYATTEEQTLRQESRCSKRSGLLPALQLNRSANILFNGRWPQLRHQRSSTPAAIPVAVPSSLRWDEISKKVPDGEVLVWTMVGGEAYQNALGGFTAMLKQLSLDHVLIVCLDQLSLATAARLHTDAVLHTLNQSVRVADSNRVGAVKFGVAAKLSAMGVTALFMELDVFIRRSPLPYFAALPEVNFAVSAHNDNPKDMNIGVMFVRPSSCTASFFGRLAAYLTSGTTLKGCGDPFDQALLRCCLRHPVAWETCPQLQLRSRTCMRYHFISTMAINSGDPPENVSPYTLGIHVLGAAPFLSPAQKSVIAKSLGFFPDEDGYYSSATARYLVLNLPIACNTVGAYGRLDRYFVRVLATLIAFAQATNRILVLPRASVKIGLSILPYQIINLEHLDELVEWREASFLDDRRFPSTASAARVRIDSDCTLSVCAAESRASVESGACSMADRSYVLRENDDPMEATLAVMTQIQSLQETQVIELEPTESVLFPIPGGPADINSSGREILGSQRYKASRLFTQLAKQLVPLVGLCSKAMEEAGTYLPDCSTILLRGGLQTICTAKRGEQGDLPKSLRHCQWRWECSNLRRFRGLDCPGQRLPPA